MDTKDSIKHLQSQIGAVVDGYWGEDSQTALVNSGKQLKYKDGALKNYFGSLSQSQVDGLDTILTACNTFSLKPSRTDLGALIKKVLKRKRNMDINPTDAINPAFVAYMLATAWHETASTMQPIREYGRGKGRKYGSKQDITGSIYRGLKHIYYGRGYVQLTWLTNYVRMRQILGVDFVNKPSLALQPSHAADIMIVGMLGGIFTGLSLSDCINYGLYFEFKKARKIINGTDKDALIAGYAVRFLDCLEIA